MQTAEKIFTFEERDIWLFVEKIWHTQGEPLDGASA